MSVKVVRFLSITLALFVTFIPTSSQSQSSSDNSNSGVVSDHDRLLLEKIDRLERRIAELEARAGIDAPAKKPDPAVTTSNVSQAARKPRQKYKPQILPQRRLKRKPLSLSLTSHG